MTAIFCGNKPAANKRPPSRTLFVNNIDPIVTKSKDLERHFEPYGRIANIRIGIFFAFIVFETQEEATKALEATNMSELLDRVITVEYEIRDDGVTSNGQSLDRWSRDRESPERGGFNRRRSPSPYREERGNNITQLLSPLILHRPGGGKKPAANERPSRTLFVLNFNPICTTKDLERHFEPYGRIARIRIRKSLAFIVFETQEEATKALEATNMSELLGSVITVEYEMRPDDVTANGQILDRSGRDKELSIDPNGKV